MSERARFVGINYVTLEVGDIDQALEFYGRIIDFIRQRHRARATQALGHS